MIILLLPSYIFAISQQISTNRVNTEAIEWFKNAYSISYKTHFRKRGLEREEEKEGNRKRE